MELQTILVNQRIDDLRQTAREVRAGSNESGGTFRAIRRTVGWRLVGLGLTLVSQGQGADRQIARTA